MFGMKLMLLTRILFLIFSLLKCTKLSLHYVFHVIVFFSSD